MGWDVVDSGFKVISAPCSSDRRPGASKEVDTAIDLEPTQRKLDFGESVYPGGPKVMMHAGGAGIDDRGSTRASFRKPSEI